MTEWLHELAALLYLVAAIVGGIHMVRGRGPGAAAVPWLLAFGATVHAGGFVVLHREVPPIPMESFPAALSLIGLLIAIGYLLSLRSASIRGVGPWVAFAAALFTGVASIDLLVGPQVVRSQAGSGTWSHAHVLLSTLGFSFLALASVAGLGYLAKERSLKQKARSRLHLPSLESLDRMEHFTLVLGFPLLTLGVVTGFVWGLDQHVSPWTAHTYWLLAAWALYLVPVGLRVVRHQRGERPARGVVLGFAVLAFSYIGIRLLGGAA
jgi:ABC-type uncharacterized transport system permease subunit